MIVKKLKLNSEIKEINHVLIKLEGACVVFIFSLILSSLETFGKLLILWTAVVDPLGIDRS